MTTMNSPDMENGTRVVIGNCPDCGVVICAATLPREAWPLLDCSTCDWQGPTTGLWNHHYFEPTTAVIGDAPQPCPQGVYVLSRRTRPGE